jgi:hypothetical protein
MNHSSKTILLLELVKNPHQDKRALYARLRQIGHNVSLEQTAEMLQSLEKCSWISDCGHGVYVTSVKLVELIIKTLHEENL